MSHAPGQGSHVLDRACTVSVCTTRRSMHVIGPCFMPASSVHGTLGETLGQKAGIRVVVSSGSSVPFAPSTSLCTMRGLVGGKTVVCLCGNKFRRSGVVVISSLFYAINATGLGDHDLQCSCRAGTFVFSGSVARRLGSIFRTSVLRYAHLAPRV